MVPRVHGWISSLKRGALYVVAVVLCAPVMTMRAQQPGIAPPVFEFHSGFWVNLHHFLYLQGRIRNARADALAASSSDDAKLPAAASTEGMSPEQQKIWNAAVAAYAQDWSSRELDNSTTGLVNDRLAELEDCADITETEPASECHSGLRPEMEAALSEAAPIYRQRWWADQDRENRAWITAVAPLVQRLGVNMAGQLSEIYQTPWSPDIVRVDVVGYAGPQGGYIPSGPAHIIISSDDPRNQGLAAFEMLFREASTTLDEQLNAAIARECRQRGEPIPRDLLQALLFYTAGTLVERTLQSATSDQLRSAGVPLPATDYVPYAIRFGLYQGAWARYRVVLERDWQPYLDGRIEFDSAIARMIEAL